MFLDEGGRGAAAALLVESHPLHRLLRLSVLGVVLADHDGRIVDVNPAMAALLGRTRAELIGRNVEEAGLHADAADRARIVTAMSSPSGEWRGEIALERPDGKPVRVVVSATHLTVGGEPCILGFFEDVSELRRIDAALRASEDELRTMFDLAPVGLMQVDGATGRYVRVNGAMAALTGRPVDELLALDVPSVTHPDDRAIDAEIIADLVAGRREQGVRDKRYLRPDGTCVWVQVHYRMFGEIAGRQGQLLGVVLDTTARRAGQAERRLLTTALQAADRGMLITDSAGTIRWVNDAFTRLTGYSHDETVGQSTDFLRSGVQPQAFYQAMWSTILSGRTWHGELVNRRKDGRLYDEEMTITPVRADGGDISHFIAIKQDVTARKRIDAGHIEAEERYRLALDAAELGTWRHDLVTDQLDFDARAQEHFGLPGPTATLAEVLALIHPDDRARVTELAATAHGVDAPGRQSNEQRMVRPDGEVRWLALHSRITFEGEGATRRPRYTIATSRDVTEARRAADALRVSEDRYRSLVDNLDDLVFSLDLDGRITFLSHAITRYGYTADELLGRQLGDFVHPVDREPMLTDLRRRLAGEVFDARERRWLDAGGRVHFVRTSVRPLVVDGTITGITGLASDVTRQRETEEQLRAVQRMEAIGRMAGGVAHDFNNLLSVITAYTELAMADLRDEDPLRADLHEIAEAAQRAAGLTRQLLAFSRRQLLEPEPVDVGVLLTGLTKMLQRLIGEDVQLHVRADEALGLTRVDRGQLEQVVMNLAVNARDAMPDGGHLTVATRGARLDVEQAAAVELPPGDYVAFDVTDTGTGMSPDVRGRIFDPFFTTKPVGKGTGLGLSMVHGIVKQSGGGIDVETAPGRGTTFRIYLPRLGKDEVRTVVVPPMPTDRDASGHERILVVEDEAALRGVTRRLLAAAGYHVEVAANAGEALLICEERGEQLDLVLTDVVMPGMSGRKLAERLSSLCPDAKVMFMSGYTDETLARHDVLQHALIRKPFDRATLAAKVRSVLDGAA